MEEHLYNHCLDRITKREGEKKRVKESKSRVILNSLQLFYRKDFIINP